MMIMMTITKALSMVQEIWALLDDHDDNDDDDIDDDNDNDNVLRWKQYGSSLMTPLLPRVKISSPHSLSRR